MSCLNVFSAQIAFGCRGQEIITFSRSCLQYIDYRKASHSVRFFFREWKWMNRLKVWGPWQDFTRCNQISPILLSWFCWTQGRVQQPGVEHFPKVPWTPPKSQCLEPKHVGAPLWGLQVVDLNILVFPAKQYNLCLGASRQVRCRTARRAAYFSPFCGVAAGRESAVAVQTASAWRVE